MPAKLESCVRQVSEDLEKKGYEKEEAERRAWAICRARLGLSMENESEEEGGMDNEE